MDEKCRTRSVCFQISLLLKEQSKQGCQCLQFYLHLVKLDTVVKPLNANFRVITEIFRCPKIKENYVNFRVVLIV